MRLLRNLLLGLLLLGLISSANAQLITPVDGSGESVGSETTKEQPKKRAPVLAAKWPFKFGRKLFGKEKATDPFLEGATAQHQLATQLAGRNNIAVAPPAPQQANSGKLIPPASYRWPAPVGSGAQAVIPAGASSITTWQPTPVEANAAAQLPSGVRQSPASSAAGQSATASATSGIPARPTMQNPNSGKRFSHFAQSSAKNPPPPAMPLPTGPLPMGGPSAPSALVSKQSMASPSANVPAAALMPDNQVAAPSTSPPQFSAAPAWNRSAIVAPAAQPTTLAAGPPAQPPVHPPYAIPTSPTPPLVPPTTASSVQSRPAPKAGQFSVDKMDQSIWGQPLARPSPPSSEGTRGMTGSEVVAPARPSSLAQPTASTSASTAIASPGDDFVPSSELVQQPSFTRTSPSNTPPSYDPPSYDPPSYDPTGTAPTHTSAAPPAQNRRPDERVSSPFPGGPSVQLLDSPVLHSDATRPSQNTLVHGTLDEGTRVLAIVGDQSILAGDVLGQVNEMLAPYRGQASDEELAFQREKIIQEMLPPLIDRKLIFYDFVKKIPIEKLPELEQEVFKHFNEKRLPEIIEKTNLNSAAELDAKLRSLGSSVANQQRLFFEQMVAAEAVQREARRDDEVSHDEMLAYYNEHQADYSFPAKVRWERLAVDPSRFASPEQAYNALARIGNEVMRGANLADVARRSSDGPKASVGGQYEWTTKGSLVNKEIDRLLFMLPIGELSKVVKSDGTYQILRVIERVEAGARPFTTVQNEIVKKTKKRRFDERVDAYVARLRDETYVWTSTDGDAAPTQVSQPPTDVLTR